MDLHAHIINSCSNRIPYPSMRKHVLCLKNIFKIFCLGKTKIICFQSNNRDNSAQLRVALAGESMKNVCVFVCMLALPFYQLVACKLQPLNDRSHETKICEASMPLSCLLVFFTFTTSSLSLSPYPYRYDLARNNTRRYCLSPNRTTFKKTNQKVY